MLLYFNTPEGSILRNGTATKSLLPKADMHTLKLISPNIRATATLHEVINEFHL